MNESKASVAPDSYLREAEPCRTPMESPKARQIVIKPMNYGFSISVGCQEFAIESLAKLLINLEAYLTNPTETEANWMRSKKLL